MARERISTVQLMMLVALSRFTLTLVYFPAMSDPDLKQDVWLASLAGALWGIPFVWVLSLLWQRFPRQTFVQVCEAVLGKAAGKLVCFFYLVYLLLMAALSIRMTGEFFVFAFLPLTPIVVVISLVTILAAWSAKAGIEVIGRAGQVVFPLLLGTIGLVFVLLLKDLNFSALSPVFIQSGPAANLKQMFNVVGRNVEFAWLGMLVPFVNEQRGMLRATVLALVCQGLIWVLMGIAVTGVMGPVQQLLYFPFFSAAQMVSIADFLERIDALVLAVWFLGMFLRIGIILWAFSLGTAQWLGVKEYRPLVLALSALTVTLSVSQAESFSELRGYIRPEVFTPFGLTFIWVLPVLLLALAALRGLRGSREGGRTTNM